MSLDIKWANPLFQKRSFKHVSPQYVFHRLRHAIARKWSPANPDLTEQSVRLLEQLLLPTDVGAEWGAGNSTAWLAQRTAKLTSFENNPAYVPVVRKNLASQGVTNADLRQMNSGWVDDEELGHQTTWVRATEEFDDDSLDYALVDSAPRGCLCLRLLPKIKRGGLLILDNANWYMPPPANLKPTPVSSVELPFGFPGSTYPNHNCWRRFVETTNNWRKLWTSNGVTATLIMVRS